ncbi:hypothetical protein [Bacillus cereus]|uniref:hypothetical protein n=1 Tax=Bacillus cereus TaxID=1396 RepID=UPI000BFC2D2B|nr:hypothetical protein [Bacillus cereus]PGW00764.1 hypothetical protein COD87_30215 [Bacillus cereus]
MFLHLLPFCIFLIYHVFNVYMDVSYRITKNYWHLTFLIIGMGYSYIFLEGIAWYKPLAIIGLTLCVGLLLEYFKQSSPGDTKMMIVTALLLSLNLPEQGHITIAAAVIIFHLSLVALFAYGKLFKINGVIKTFKYQISDIKAFFTPGVPISKVKIFDYFPGAITISLGSIIYIFLSLTLELR